jgi:hypothetical protein
LSQDRHGGRQPARLRDLLQRHGERAALDAAFDPRVKDIDPASRTWRNRALKLEEKYTTGWAEAF